MRPLFILCATFVLSAFFATFSPAMAQCETSNGRCTIEDGTYTIMLPDADVANGNAVIYLHGFGGNGQGALRQSHVTSAFLDKGFAVIGPNGLPRAENRPNSWNFMRNPDARDETAFLGKVADHASAQFGLKRDRILLSGFSIGASMTHYVACNQPDLFAAYAPVAGSFWRPHPISCNGPVKLLHTHGWKDGTFPLEGRRIRPGFTQGDAFSTIHIWREANSCDQPRAKKFSESGQFMRRAWTECISNSALEFALFNGGHVVPAGWSDMVIKWFEDLSEG